MDRNESVAGRYDGHRVVPYVGTWIEIYKERRYKDSPTVVPYVGTWIEISEVLERKNLLTRCRSLRGNVDRNIMNGLETRT